MMISLETHAFLRAARGRKPKSAVALKFPRGQKGEPLKLKKKQMFNYELLKKNITIESTRISEFERLTSSSPRFKFRFKH